MAGMAQVKDSHAVRLLARCLALNPQDYPLLQAYINKLDNLSVALRTS